MPEFDGKSYACRCGHGDEDHEVTEAGTICRADHCYCGRNPMEFAKVVTCDWCSVGAPIVWCRTAKGRRMPVEPEPNPGGNCEISFSQGTPVVTVHKGPPGMFDEWTPYMPHHARCDMKLKRN